MFQKQNISKLFLIAVFCAAGFGAAGEARATLIFDGTIHAGDYRAGGFGPLGSGSTPGYGPYTGWYCSVKEDTLSTVAAPDRVGQYALRVITRAGEMCGSNANHATIEEVLTSIPNTYNNIFIGWSSRMESPFPLSLPGTADWQHFGASTASSSFHVGNTGLYLDMQSTASRQICLTINAANGGYNCGAIVLTGAQNTMDMWHDWVINVKWSFNADGYVDIWHKTGSETNYIKLGAVGEGKHFYSGKTLDPLNANTGFYFRSGVYRAAEATTTQVSYHMDGKIGTTFDDVKYGGTSTPPPPDTEKPTVSITCPTDGATYDTLVTTVSGTATDNVGVKEVWVKVGTGGAWQKATLTSPNAASTDWSISGLTGIVVGANTIYAKSIDTSDNDSIPTGSVESDVLINVTISAGFVPAAPGGTVLWDSTFTGSETYTGWLLPWGAWGRACSKSSEGLTIMDAGIFGRSGKYMTKYVLNLASKCYPTDSTSRVELHEERIVNVINEGTEEYYGFSYYIPPGYLVSPGDADLIWQVKARMLRQINPNVRLEIEAGNNLYFGVCGGDITGITAGCGGILKYYSLGINMANGIWHDFVIHVIWSKTNGTTEVWHKTGSETNYTRVHSVSGLPNLQHESGTLGDFYLKGMGIYSLLTHSASTITTYAMEYKIGTTFDSVKYGSAGGGSSSNPAPTCAASAAPPDSSVCPDGICNGAETMYTCPADCPYIPLPVVCGDSIDGLCPDGCTYLEDIDCSPPPPPLDTTPPTVPQKLTATGSITVPAIDLVWRASTDDRGVAGYNIYRDGIKIATVIRLSYTDTDVIFGEAHTYTVSAFDAAGNESGQSDPAIAMSAPLNAEFKKAVSASDFPQLVGNFLKWILTVAGSLALLIMIIGGVMYTSSSGDEQKTVLSKKIVIGAIGGLILILMAYSIITLLGGII